MLRTWLLITTATLTITNAAYSAGPSYSPSASQRQELLRVREEVWRAWYANDQNRMQQIVPEQLTASDPGETGWKGRPEFLAGAIDFAKNKGRLISLSFPKTEIQIFGDVAVLYSSFEVHFEYAGKQQQLAGRATEIFHRENGQWKNTGWTLDSRSNDAGSVAPERQ